MKNSKSIFPTFFQIIVRPIFRLILKFFSGLEVHGAKNLLLQKKVIFASNHISEADPVTVGSCIPFRYLRYLPIFFTSLPGSYYKKERFGWRSFFYRQEWFFKMLGAYPVDKNKKNYELSLKYHLEILEEGYSVLMFPEGKMSKDGEMGRIHGGAVYLSKTTKTPIVPVYIKIDLFEKRKNFVFCRKQIKIFYGKPIEVELLFEELSHIDEGLRYREVMKTIFDDFKKEVCID